MRLRLEGQLRHLLGFTGAVAAVWGVAYPINGATQTGAYVTIPVVPLRQVHLSEVRLAEGVVVPQREMWLDVWGSTMAEQVLSRGDVLLSGLCVGVAAFLLRALLTAAGTRPAFDGRLTVRVTWLGGVLALTAGVVGPLLPYLAGAMALNRTGMTDSFAPSAALSWIPLVGALFLFTLAKALKVRSHMTA